MNRVYIYYSHTKLLLKLGFPLQGDTQWGGLKGGQVMAQPKPVFARIETQTEIEDKGTAVEKTVKKTKRKVVQPQSVAEA